MQQFLALQDLCARLDRGTLGRADFADRCSASIAAQVGCSAAGLWLMFDTDAGRIVQSIGRSSAGSRWGLDLHAPCDRFAASLKSEGAVVAQDARSHAATAGFFDPTLPPSPVRSMLAIAFSINGDLFGAFVCVQFDQMIRWSAPQVSTLRRLGVGISSPLARATSFTMSVRPVALPPPPWETQTARSPATVAVAAVAGGAA